MDKDMEDKQQEQLMQLEIVKNHLREAYKALHGISMQDCKSTDIKDPEKFIRLCNRSEVIGKARDLISSAMFVLKTDIVKLFWGKDGNDRMED